DYYCPLYMAGVISIF
nr:immunoglobulin light chain junction region [Macaca mulatta]